MSSATKTTLKCREVRDAMVAFFEGSVPSPVREALIAHLSRCRRCHLLYEEAAAVRRLLSGDSTPGDFPPDGLAERIKRAAREAHDDAQIRSGKAVTVIGSPAFVATCATLIIGAFMSYAVTTQVYMRHLDARLADTAPIARLAATPSSVVVAGPAATPLAPVASAPLAVATVAATAPARMAMAAPATHQATVPLTTRRRSRLAPVARPAVLQPAAAPPRPAPAPQIASAPRPVVAFAAASAAGLATRAALLRASRAVTAPTPAAAGPRLALASAASAEVTPAAPAPAAEVSAQPDDASAGLAAGLVAHYVVERYLAEHLARTAPSITMVSAISPARAGSPGPGPGY